MEEVSLYGKDENDKIKRFVGEMVHKAKMERFTVDELLSSFMFGLYEMMRQKSSVSMRSGFMQDGKRYALDAAIKLWDEDDG